VERYAEYALALEEQVHRLPDNVSSSRGPAFVWVPYGTIYAIHHFAKSAGLRKPCWSTGVRAVEWEQPSVQKA